MTSIQFIPPAPWRPSSPADWPFGDLMPLSFNLMSVDPPWAYELYSEAGNEKAASAQYDTMPLEDIMSMPIGHLAAGDCLLLLWGCGWMPPAQRQGVMEAWGFTYKTELVWRKTTKKGKVRMGPGYRARTMHEPVYLGVIGNPKHKPFPSLFDGVAREHSRKPEEFYSMAKRHMPGANCIDIFSRQSRPGWTNWGRESTKFDAGSPALERPEEVVNEVAERGLDLFSVP